MEALAGGASIGFGLGGSFGGIFDDEFLATDLAGEIANLLYGFFHTATSSRTTVDLSMRLGAGGPAQGLR